MFNDLYSFIPERWRFYINELDLRTVINKLNKHEEKDVLPCKRNIFECLQYTDPDNVHAIILGDPTPIKELASGIAYSVPFEYRFTDIYERIPNPPVQSIVYDYMKTFIEPLNDKTLIEACKRGILLMNYPLTCSTKNKHAHDRYGWDIILKLLIERLLYRDKPLLLIAWNYGAFKVYHSIIPDWFPNQHGIIYKTPQFKDVKMLISSSPNKNDDIKTNDQLYAKYKAISSRIAFGNSSHGYLLKCALKRHQY